MENKPEHVVKKPSLTGEEQMVLNIAKNRLKNLNKDPNQDKATLKGLLENKLEYLKRLEERTSSRVDAEMPRGLSNAQKAVRIESEKSYVEDIELLKSLLKKV